MEKDIKPRRVWHPGTFSYFLLDCVLMGVAVVCALRFSPRLDATLFHGIGFAPGFRFVGYGLPLALALGLQVAGAHRTRAHLRFTEILLQASLAIAGGLLAFSALHAAVQFSLIGRYVLLIAFAAGVALAVGSRLGLAAIVAGDPRRVLVFGSDAAAAALAAESRRLRLPVAIVGQIETGETLPAECARLAAEEIVVESPGRLAPADRAALLRCTEAGVHVVDLGFFYERDCERVHLPVLREEWFWDFDPAHAHPAYTSAKRAMDIGIGLAGLLAFLPAAPLVFLLIKLQDGGPVFYRQTRVGLRNRPFLILKFRTMRLDSEAEGVQWAKENDDRATAFGRFLRRTRLDEVPQFWNILRGEMAFIGPRPERPEWVGKLELEIPFYRQRHLIKPGLTGWAQVNCSYGASVADTREKLSYDLHYLKHASLTRDLHIVLRTVVAMVKGAR